MPAADADTPWLPVVVAGLTVAVVAPIFFFPFSRTIWAAIDLTMRPVPVEDSAAPTAGSEPLPPAELVEPPRR